MTRLSEQAAFASFCKIRQVAYWRQQLNESNIKNLNKCNSGTRKCYTYGLYQFNNWLKKEKFLYVNPSHNNSNKHNLKKATITLKDVGHFLELYQSDQIQKLDFVTFIKQYLLWVREHKGNSMVLNALYSIKSFFRENDSEIVFRFNKKNIKNFNESILTIGDLEKMLTDKNTQLIEKAVFLCKFQRGLDSSTFADRFNFEVWVQLVNYFKTDTYHDWDLNKCPVPIKLIRVKTNYAHLGFLDIDAIVAIQNYLEDREKNIKKHMQKQIDIELISRLNKGEAMFLDSSGNAISVNWIGRRFHKLYNNIIWKKASCSKAKCTSHELRDLLKSTLVDAGCRIDIADHILGHAPKDSYEKQTLLYQSSIRDEYIKCSNRVNFLSKSNNSSSLKTLKFNSMFENSNTANFSCTNRQFSFILLKLENCKENIAQIEHIIRQINDSAQHKC